MAALHGTLQFCKARLEALEICWASSPEVDVLGPILIKIKQASIFTIERMGATASARVETQIERPAVALVIHVLRCSVLAEFVLNPSQKLGS